jgi:hypothetical protein
VRTEHLAIFLATGIGILVGLNWLKNHTPEMQPNTPQGALAWSTWGQQHIATVPGPQSTWSLI